MSEYSHKSNSSIKILNQPLPTGSSNYQIGEFPLPGSSDHKIGEFPLLGSSDHQIGEFPLPGSSDHQIGEFPLPGSSDHKIGEFPEQLFHPTGAQKGWYRRNLPHCDKAGLIQFITYRLADSIPTTILNQIKNELKLVSNLQKVEEERRRMETLLDRGHGSGILREKMAAECIVDNWYHFAGHRYDLLAWVIMPTHVHILIRQYHGESLPKIVQSWKSYTGKRLKALFPSSCVKGEFWKREYWDRYIRDEIHFELAVNYILNNPVKARLVTRPEDWPYVCVLRNVSSELALGRPRL